MKATVKKASTLSLSHGRPTYRYQDFDHVPWNKRHGEVYASTATLEVNDLEAGDQSFTRIELTEQTRAKASSNLVGRTISLSLDALERVRLIAFLNREPFAKLVEYHTERAEYETEAEANAAIAVAVDLGLLPDMASARVVPTFNHSAGCWRYPVAVFNHARQKDFWLTAWSANLVGR